MKMDDQIVVPIPKAFKQELLKVADAESRKLADTVRLMLRRQLDLSIPAPGKRKPAAVA